MTLSIFQTKTGQNITSIRGRDEIFNILREVNEEIINESYKDLIQEGELVFESIEKQEEFIETAKEFIELVSLLQEYTIIELLSEGFDENYVSAIFPYIVENSYRTVSEILQSELVFEQGYEYKEEIQESKRLNISGILDIVKQRAKKAAEITKEKYNTTGSIVKSKLNEYKQKLLDKINKLKQSERYQRIKDKLNKVKEKLKQKKEKVKTIAKRAKFASEEAIKILKGDLNNTKLYKMGYDRGAEIGQRHGMLVGSLVGARIGMDKGYTEGHRTGFERGRLFGIKIADRLRPIHTALIRGK